MKSLFILTLLLFVEYSNSYSAPQWKNFTDHSHISSIWHDSNYIFVATGGGLVKMNKNTEEKIFMDRANKNLPDNNILEIAKDSEGRLWIGGMKYGIGYLLNDTVYNFNSSNSELPSNQVNYNFTFANDGTVWFASLSNLVKFKDNKFKSWQTGNIIMSNNLISGIALDTSGKVWLSGSWGLATFENDSIRYIPEIKCYLTSLNFDSKGNLWMSSTEKGLIYYNGINYKYFDTTNSKLPSNNIIKFCIDDVDNLWISSDAGFSKFNADTVSTYSLNDLKLDYDYISDIEIDENIIWLGTSFHGIIKFDGSNFKHIDLNNCSIGDNYVSDIAIDSNNNKLFATNYVSMLNANNQWQIIAENTLYKSYNSLNCSIDGKLWMGKYFSAFANPDSSVIYYKNGKIVTFDSTMTKAAKYSVNVIINDKSNNIWFGTEGGLFKYNSNSWESFNKSNSPLTTNMIRDLKFDNNGVLWGTCGNIGFGANYGCVFNYNGANWHIYQNIDKNIRSNFFDALTIDSKNNIWVTARDSGNFVGIDSGEGLLKFDGTTWTQFIIYNSPLPSNTIFDIYCDKNDIIWIGTFAGGLVKYDGKTDWKVYNVFNSGISNNDINVLKKDADDILWIGHNRGGVSCFNENITNINNNEESNRNLFKIFPNPVSDYLKIDFVNNCSMNISINIYNNLGISVYETTLFQSNSYNSIEINADKLPSGVYYCNINFENYSETKKFAIIK